MRRSLLKLLGLGPMLGPSGDGLARPANAPPAVPPSYGTQPGTTQAIVIANRIIIIGPGGELLVYSGTPALNNLLASIVATNTTDKPGNNLLPVITAYAQLGAGSWAADSLQGNGIVIQRATAQNAAYFSKAHAVWTDQITSPGFQLQNTASGATLQLLDAVQETMAVGPLVAQDPASAGTPESWHSLGTLAGYTVTRGRYQLDALGWVNLDISVDGAGANAASVTFSNTLPAAYRPLASNTLGLTTNATPAPPPLPRVGITAAGAVLVVSQANITGTISGTVRYPLN